MSQWVVDCCDVTFWKLSKSIKSMCIQNYSNSSKFHNMFIYVLWMALIKTFASACDRLLALYYWKFLANLKGNHIWITSITRFEQCWSFEEPIIQRCHKEHATSPMCPPQQKPVLPVAPIGGSKKVKSPQHPMSQAKQTFELVLVVVMMLVPVLVMLVTMVFTCLLFRNISQLSANKEFAEMLQS